PAILFSSLSYTTLFRSPFSSAFVSRSAGASLFPQPRHLPSSPFSPPEYALPGHIPSVSHFSPPLCASAKNPPEFPCEYILLPLRDRKSTRLNSSHVSIS